MWSIDNSRRDGPSPSVTVITEEKRLGGSSSGAIVVRNRPKFQTPLALRFQRAEVNKHCLLPLALQRKVILFVFR